MDSPVRRTERNTDEDRGHRWYRSDGSKVVSKLGEHGHETVAAAPSTGVNTLTGEGLADALAGASVVIDVSNSPSWEDTAVLEFF
jgi:phosphoribosyl-ATP pyrophosphohydrolase